MSTKSKAAQDIPSSAIDELKVLLRDAEAALANTGDAADDKINGLRTRLRSAMDETQNFYRKARESAREQLDRADDYVHEHPYHAVGLAALVGAVAGVLLSRRWN